MMGRNLNRRLDRLEARATPSGTPLEFEIQFVCAQTGAVSSTLFVGGGRQERQDNEGSGQERSALPVEGLPSISKRDSKLWSDGEGSPGRAFEW